MAGLFSTQSITLQASRQLLGHGQDWARMTERLASGLRVNSARDDAASLAIADRMLASTRADAVVSRGLMDGVSLVQVADAGLDRIADALQRARELAVQSANGTLGDGDRLALDAEYQALMAQIDQIAGSNQAFGVHLLMGQGSGSGSTPGLDELFPGSGSTLSGLASGIRPLIAIPAGATGVQIDIDALGADDDLQIFTADGRHLLGTPLSDRVWQNNAVSSAADMASRVLLPGHGFAAGASYDASQLLDGSSAFVDGVAMPLTQTVAGMTLSYSGDGDHQDGSANDGSVSGAYRNERLTIDTVTQPLLIMVVGSGAFNATASWLSMPADAPADPDKRTGPIDITLQAEFGAEASTARIRQLPSDTATLGLSGSGVASAAASQAAMDALDAALDVVGGYRAELGAASSRFERAVAQAQLAIETRSAARGRIMDADMAATLSQQVSARILAESGQAMLQQANALPEQVLDALLGGLRTGG